MAAVTQSHHSTKVTIVGVGNVGMAAAYALLNQHAMSELVLIDVERDKVRGEVLDLLHGVAASKLPTLRISGGSDYVATAASDVVVLTAGVRQRTGESRQALLHRNELIVSAIVKEIVKYSPNAVLVVATNPCDVMTYLTWKVSGFPSSRVIGTGTSLDSSRFRHLLSECLNIDVRSVHATVIGEHGDTAVLLFSSANISGTPLASLDSSFGKTAEWKELSTKVIQSAYEVVKLKGYTSFGIGLVIASLVGSILRDEHVIAPVSTLVPTGLYGLPGPVYLSLPAVLGRDGVRKVVPQVLTSDEVQLLHASAERLVIAQNQLETIRAAVPFQSGPSTDDRAARGRHELWTAMLPSRL